MLSLSRLRGMPRTEDAAQAREFTQPALASRLPIAPSDAAWDACRRKLSSEHVSALCACGPGCGDLRTPVLSSATSADPVDGLPGIIPELHEVGGSVGLCQPPAGPSARRCTSHARTRRSYSAVYVCVVVFFLRRRNSSSASCCSSSYNCLCSGVVDNGVEPQHARGGLGRGGCG